MSGRPALARMVPISLKRITDHRAYIPEIDGLRCVAILSVVLVHIRSSLTHNAAIQNSMDPLLPVVAKRGVELFFMISGFVLALPFMRCAIGQAPPVNLKRYFLRRLTRLEPPYVVSLAIAMLAAVATGSGTWSGLAPHFVASIVYAHYFVFGGTNPLGFITWSLEVEVQFYLLAPLIAQLFLKRKLTRRVALSLVLCASCALSMRLNGTYWQGTVALYLPFFLCGILLADVYLDPPKSATSTSWIWDGVALALWPAVWLVGPSHEFTALPIILSILFVSVFKGRLSRQIMSLSWVTTLGGMCYSIYLLHVTTLSALSRITKPIHFGHQFWAYYVTQVALLLPAVLLVGTVFFVVLERPCMRPNWPAALKQRLKLRFS